MIVTVLLALLFSTVSFAFLHKSRNKIVTELRVRTNFNSPYRMFLDEPFDTLVAAEILREDQRSEAIPTEEQGNGQFYYPRAPTFDSTLGIWSFEGTS